MLTIRSRLVPTKLSLILGSKFEHNNRSGFEVQPNGRAALDAYMSHQSCLGSGYQSAPHAFASRSGLAAHRPPTSELLAFFPRVMGNKNFKSERLLGTEVGYRTLLIDSNALRRHLHLPQRLQRPLWVWPWVSPAGEFSCTATAFRSCRAACKCCFEGRIHPVAKITLDWKAATLAGGQRGRIPICTFTSTISQDSLTIRTRSLTTARVHTTSLSSRPFSIFLNDSNWIRLIVM